jgi:hypothetical protein
LDAGCLVLRNKGLYAFRYYCCVVADCNMQCDAWFHTCRIPINPLAVNVVKLLFNVSKVVDLDSWKEIIIKCSGVLCYAISINYIYL